ncbi:ketoacyl-ACP synthase III [bacterium]|nr:ketoacyl-ACP synthase III [bacterium]MBU1984846.1 ketoacyl-ACP synthase III [bacterium]
MARIAGIGKSVPETILTNADLEKIVDTSDEWITARSGIKERRIMRRGDKTSDYCIAAARQALERAGVSPEELEFIILGTISPDMRFPATAIFVQEALNAVNAAAWDISATCSGFLYSLYQGEAIIALGRARKGLVIGAEMLTSVTDYTDRGTCVLFGDGAGAVVLTEAEQDERGILSTYLGSGGNASQFLYCIGQGTVGSVGTGNAVDGERFCRMNGNEVFKYAVRTLVKSANESLRIAGLTTADVDWLVPHQANLRIMEATAERLGIPREKVYVNIHKYGNTSSASVPIALEEGRQDGSFKDGQVLCCIAFGGGFTWGGATIRL